jgi:FixJ family two-component response regulator
MSEKRILVVDDEIKSNKRLGEILAGRGFGVTFAKDAQDAITIYRNNPFGVVITDLDKPGADSGALINELKKIEDKPVLVVMSSHGEPDWIIETMKNGAYDYIVKPFDADDFIIKIERAYETARLRRMEMVLQKEKVIKLENQLNWLKWKDDLVRKDEDRIDRALFKSLHTNFNQGSGFGLLISLLDMITTSGKKEGDRYIIKAKLFDMILKSKQMAENVIKTFAEINTIISNEFSFTRISLDYLYSEIKSVIDKALKYKDIKKQNILISEKKPYYVNVYVKWDRGLFHQALFELLINGFKFSKETSIITVILTEDDKNLYISVISEPEPLRQGITGIPIEYENLVFEPFFRMVNVVVDGYNTSDYGLGLTKARKTIEKLNGSLSVTNIKDHTDFSWEPVTKVCFTITLPLDT